VRNITRMAERGAAIKTFLIADVRGYTAFTQKQGDEAAARLAARFAELAEASIDTAGGSLIELRGDEALAVFDSSRQAIRAAVDLQAQLVAETVADPSLPLAVGIGLDAGEAVPVDGGYRGGALNLAARLCSLAGPGEVLASREVTHLARRVEGVTYVERGSARLKGLDGQVDVIRVRPELDDVAQELAFRRALGPVAVQIAKGLGTGNPYKGLRAFEEADAEDFFGREALTEHLVEQLSRTRFLAVVGPSGSGKSSVVRAGLVPALRKSALPESDSWRIVEMFPGAYPLEELEAALLRVADGPPSLIEQLEDGERGLLRALKRILPDDSSELVLVVDQLEEVFTLVDDEPRRTHFLSILERAVTDPHSRLRVVTTLRADFYDRPLLYSGFAELLRDYVEAVVPLTPDEFERAISGPAQRVGATLEPGLLSEMVADVANEPGALPLLEYALTELYERREGNVLTRAAYEAIGGVSGALAGRAEEIYSGLDEKGRDAARQLFLQLVTLGEGTEDTRRRVSREELDSIEVDQSEMNAALDAFGGSRLLSFDRDPRTGTRTVEVAHEALLRAWGRLRRWIDSAREDVRMHRRLSSAAREWSDSDRDPSFLLRGSHLAQFDALAAESGLALTGLEREFVDASRIESRRELAHQQRQNRRLKILLSGVGVLLLAAIVAGIVALLQRQSAKHQATVALARQLGSEAVIEPRIDLAMLLARESVNLDESTDTEGTLLATLLRSPSALATFTLPIDVRPCCDITLSPDRQTLAVPDNANHVRFVDTRTRRTRKVISDFGFTTAPAYSADGSLVADHAGGKTPVVEVRDARSLSVHRRLQLDRRWLSTPTVNPTAPFFFTPGKRSLLYVYNVAGPNGDGPAFVDRWDLRTGKLVGTTPVGANGASDAVLVDGGRQLAVAGSSDVTFLDTNTWKKIRSIPRPEGFGAISPTGRLAAVGSDVGSVSFVDLATGHVTTGLGGHSARVVRERFSPDGRTLVTTGEDGSVIVWDSATASPVQRLNGHANRPLGIAFSSDGQTLYTASLDGAVFEWDLGARRRFGVPLKTFSGPLRLGPDAQTLAPPLAIASDGSRFAVRTGPAGIGLYSTRTLDRVAQARFQGPEVIGAAWSRTSKLVLVGDNGRVEIWDVQGRPRFERTLKGLGSINKQPEAVTTAAFSPDGSLVAAGDINHTPGMTPYRFGTIAVWNVGTGKLLWKARTKEGWTSTVAFSPDGKTVLAGRENGVVTLYDARTARVKRKLHLRGGGPETATFAPDGTLATGNWAGIVQRWNTDTGAEIGHPALVAAAPVASISFAPSGDVFATAGGSDGLAKLWTTATLQQYGATFPGDPGQWGNAQYTPDGSKLIVIYQDGKGFVWPVSVGSWEDRACSVAGRNFTREEWSRFVGDRSYSSVCPGRP
jgi:WD40 repeat protein/class 3 adenylate cyclase